MTIAAPDPQSVADGVERPLDRRWIGVQRVVGWIVTLSISSPLLLALLPVTLLAPLPGWAKVLLWLVWVALTAALAWMAHAWPLVDHRHASYKADALGIEIRRGVLWRKVIHVPRSRVQHTDVSQGPLERAAAES